MKRTVLLLAAVLGLANFAAKAQHSGNRAVNILYSNISRNGNDVNIDFLFGYDKLYITSNEQLVVTPQIVKDNDTVSLQPVVFMGRKREKVNDRRELLYGKEESYIEPYQTEVFHMKEIRKRKVAVQNINTPIQSSEDLVSYEYSFAYRPWMDGSTIIVKQELTSCGSEPYPYYTAIGNFNDIRPVMPEIVFIIPDYEVVKSRTQKMTAHVNFEQDKYVIKPEIANNREELQKIYDFTEKIMNDRDLNVKTIRIKGFASPEATYQYNSRLSANRVNALRENLINRYNITPDKFVMETEPEDWDSLRKWIASSDIRYRDLLLDIINQTPDPDARDAKIRRLDNSVTYNMLLNDVYPQLRRVDYSIDYDVAQFTVESARVMIYNNPRHMSLHEMYMVADSYPQESADYEMAFAIAARHYPDDIVANNNMAAVALKRGNQTKAREHLEKVKHDPRCMNNLGVMYLRDGDIEEAERYFRTAAENGSKEAEYNLANLHALY